MGFEPFQEALNAAAKNYGVAREYRAIKVCRTFQSIIPLIFEGNEEAPKILNQNSFKEGLLTIKVPSSTWANEIMIRKEPILEAVNSQLQLQPEQIRVKDLRTKIA